MTLTLLGTLRTMSIEMRVLEHGQVTFGAESAIKEAGTGGLKRWAPGLAQEI